MEANRTQTLLSFLGTREYTEDEKRFMIELEFVQSLSNVFYLKCMQNTVHAECHRVVR